MKNKEKKDKLSGEISSVIKGMFDLHSGKKSLFSVSYAQTSGRFYF